LKCDAKVVARNVFLEGDLQTATVAVSMTMKEKGRSHTNIRNWCEDNRKENKLLKICLFTRKL